MTDQPLTIQELEEISTHIEQENRADAIKREIDLGNGVTKTIWIKGYRVVETEYSIPNEIWKELSDMK